MRAGRGGWALWKYPEMASYEPARDVPFDFVAAWKESFEIVFGFIYIILFLNSDRR